MEGFFSVMDYSTDCFLELYFLSYLLNKSYTTLLWIPDHEAHL